MPLAVATNPLPMAMGSPLASNVLMVTTDGSIFLVMTRASSSVWACRRGAVNAMATRERRRNAGLQRGRQTYNEGTFMSANHEDITGLLDRVRAGDDDARNRL